MIDADQMPDFAAEEGGVSFTDTDLEAMGDAVMAGEAEPYGTVIIVGLPDRSASSQFEGDRNFVERVRATVTTRDGTVMNRLAGVVREGGFAMTMDGFDSQLPISGDAFLTLLFIGYDERLEHEDFAETVVQSLSLTAGPTTPADAPSPDAPLVLLDGALIIDALPRDWIRFSERDAIVSFSSAGGYQGFITFETDHRATIAAELSTTFTGMPTQRRGEIMGIPARIFEGRQNHDAFLQGFNMVAGARVVALPDLCLPGGSPLAITWAGSPRWFEQGAFDRFFEVARFEGLVPCPSVAENPASIPPTDEIAVPDPQPQPQPQPQLPPDAPAQPSAPEPPQPQAPLSKPELAAAPPPVSPPAETGDLSTPELEAEILYWESVREMDTRVAYDSYLTRWPDGQFAAIARLRLARSSEVAPAQDASIPPPPDDAATLSACHFRTDGTISDPFAAISACRSALDIAPGDPELHHRLARALQASGAEAEAVNHFRQAAEGGNPLAMTALALAYRRGQGVAPDDVQAVRWYRAGAEAGDAQAMNNLGFMYGQGLGGLRPDPAQAAHWYLRAAEAGSLFAMNNIGRHYMDGRGVAQDFAQARYWLQRGADAGHLPAMNNLGSLYATGQGVPVDHQQAMAWFRRAANEGHAPAMANVALAYSNGNGVAVNPAQAAWWFEQSIRGGSGESVLGVLGGLPRPVISALQQRLRDAGVYAGSVDGIVGAQTRNAVRALEGLGG